MNHNRPVPPVTIEAMNKEPRFDDRQYLNPELQFLPDNDTDDYTMAVVMINEEFAAIREEEQKSSDVTKEITKEIRRDYKKRLQEEVLLKPVNGK